MQIMILLKIWLRFDKNFKNQVLESIYIFWLSQEAIFDLFI